MWTQLTIPDWLAKGTIRSESELRSDTSSAATDLDEPDPDGFDDELYEDIRERDATKRDLEEACGIRGPLEMRYTPDGTHCIATWNVNNGFDTEAIAKLMLRGTISILFIQEPKQQVTDTDIGFINKGLMKYGLRGYCTRYQFLIYNETVLGARIENVTSQLEGRLITCDLQVHDATDNVFIKITGCYAVPQGDMTYKDESTRAQHRRDLYHTLMKAMQTQTTRPKTKTGFKSVGKSYIGELFLGDLQETITTTTRDNQGGTKYNRLEFGVLSALDRANKDMISLVYELDGTLSYITREPLSRSTGGRGISHIMGTPAMEALYLGGCVDKCLAATMIHSDHHLVAADFALQIQDLDVVMDRPPIVKYKWGTISNIKMDCVKNEENGGTPVLTPRVNTPHTDQWKENMHLFDELQEKMEKDPKMEARAHTFYRQMEDLQLDLKKASMQLTPQEQQDGVLIDRLPQYKDRLQVAWTSLDESFKMGAETLGLKKMEDPLKIVQDNIRSLKDPNDKRGHLRATASFTSIIQHARHLKATVGALQQASKKVRNTTPGSALHNRFMNAMHHFAGKLIFQADQYKLGERLVEAIESAEYQQEERQKVQDCYSKRRGKLDKFEGEGRRENSLDLNVEERLKINKLLQAAGCSNLFDTTQECLCEVIENEEARNWNKVKTMYDDHDKGNKRWCELLVNNEFHQAIQDSVETLTSISKTATNQRYKFKRLHIRHAALTMSTRDISRLLLQKAGDLPEPKQTIVDAVTRIERPCESVQEMMESTQSSSQHYMSPSAARRQIHSVSVTEDRVGPSGINIEVDRDINLETMRDTIPNFDKLDKEAQEFAMTAQRTFEAVFKDKREEAKELNYAFFFDGETGEFSDEKLKDDYYKSISTIPGKARHNGFHLAVIGRMPKPWVDGVLLFLQNVLVSRCPPPSIKEMTRIPIPKGMDKPGQTRPISLADDVYSFLTAQVSRTLSEGIEATGRLGPEITAYRKGRSTTDITQDERAIIEDALEFCHLLGIIKEDEEKFFDRVSTDLQMLAMKVFGFPDQGYCEWKMEDMIERKVNITTRYGNVWTVFLTGVPQGSTLSVHIANLIIWMKHRMMRLDEDNVTKERTNPYKFKVWDQDLDDQPRRSSFSYCDDNNGVHGARTLHELYAEVAKSVRMTGYFSVASKLGRIGSKSMIQLYNLDPRHAAEISEWTFESYAWSFAHDSIIKEAMPFRAHFWRDPKKMENLSDANKEALAVLTRQHGVLKSLGVRMRTDRPDSKATGVAKRDQALTRLNKMRFNGIDDKALSIILNSLVVSLAQFAALESNISSADCNKIDRLILNKVHKGFGLSKNVMMDVIFLSNKQLGMNVRNFHGTMLAAKARELECGLNGELQYCASLRARWQAWAERREDGDDINRNNFLEDGLLESNVRMLARFGIYLRDSKYKLCNVMMDLIMADAINGKLGKKRKYSGPIGTHTFRKTMTGVLGDGNESLLDFSTFSPRFNEIRTHMEKCEAGEAFPEWTSPTTWNFKRSGELKRTNIDASKLADYAKKAIEQIRNDAISSYNFAQWAGERNFKTDLQETALEWAKNTQMWCQPCEPLRDENINLDTTIFEERIRRNMVEGERLDGRRRNDRKDDKNLWNLLHENEDEIDDIPTGVGQDTAMYQKLDDLYPTTNHSPGGRQAWFR